jgi:hypothetical protein
MPNLAKPHTFNLSYSLLKLSLSVIALNRRINVPYNPCRIPNNDGIGRNSVCYDGTCTHHGSGTYCQAGQNSGVCPDGSSLFYVSSWKTLKTSPSRRELVIGKSDIRADKNVVFEMHAIPELNSAFDRDPIANGYIIFDEYMITDIAVTSYCGTGKNIYECPNTGALSYFICLH